MNKVKIAVFIFLFILFFSVVYQHFGKSLIEMIAPQSINHAVITHLGLGDYLVGDNDVIKPGYYDVQEMKGNNVFNSVQLSEGDQLLGEHLTVSSHVTIEGKGLIKLIPAKYKRLPFQKNKGWIIHHSGFYKVGRQLPAGNYQLSYSILHGEPPEKKPFVQILPSYGEDPKQSIDLSSGKSYNITLKNGEILEAHKSLFEEYDNLVIVLKPK